MKLIIQIPCLNEAETLPLTLADLPRHIVGIDTIEWLVIDDGSTDNTVEVARAHGVDHIISLATNAGLAKAFMAGVEASLERGADIIVNTDADNQYNAACIPDLIKPILDKRALIVVGSRPIMEIEHFSPIKKFLQKLGSRVVSMACGMRVEDAPSGFRAIHRDAAVQLYVFNNFTYTLETLIQAGRKGISVAWVPVRVNIDLRRSRLIKSISTYIGRSLGTILRIFLIYEPFRVFAYASLFLFLVGLFGLGRFLIYFLIGEGTGHIQSIVISSALLASSIILFVAGLLSELIASNRILLEDIRTRLITLRIERLRSSEVDNAFGTSPGDQTDDA